MTHALSRFAVWMFGAAIAAAAGVVLAVLSQPADAQTPDLRPRLEQLSERRQAFDTRPSGHDTPLTWSVSEQPRGSPVYAFRHHQVCALTTERLDRNLPPSLIYTAGRRGRHLAFVPARAISVSGPQPVLIEHTSGFNALVSMEPTGWYLILTLTPEMDALIRDSLGAPGTFRFTHIDVTTTLEAAGAAEQFAALDDCETRLSPLFVASGAAPASRVDPGIEQLVRERRWNDAILLLAHPSNRRPLYNNYFVISQLMRSPAANDRLLRSSLYDNRNVMFAAHRTAQLESQAEGVAVGAFVEGIVQEFAPVDLGPASRLYARDVAHCRAQGGTVRGSGSMRTCWSH
ncbi:MAG: hypothetical protein LAT81_00360 [Oceanicaulis sp.]|nr:hypothetical protein [Oceanicaulis sp.]